MKVTSVAKLRITILNGLLLEKRRETSKISVVLGGAHHKMAYSFRQSVIFQEAVPLN